MTQHRDVQGPKGQGGGMLKIQKSGGGLGGGIFQIRFSRF